MQCVCLAVMEDCEEPEDEAYLTYVLMVDPSLDPHPSNGSGGADAVGAAAPSGAAGGGGDGAPSPAHASHGAEAVDAGVAGSPPRADCAVGGSGDVSAPPGALHRPQTRHAARAAAARHVAACGPGVQGEVLFDERALLDRLVEHVREVDPDVVVGFEVQGGSLGYLIDRAATLGTGEGLVLGRTPLIAHGGVCCGAMCYQCSPCPPRSLRRSSLCYLCYLLFSFRSVGEGAVSHARGQGGAPGEARRRVRPVRGGGHPPHGPRGVQPMAHPHVSRCLMC